MLKSWGKKTLKSKGYKKLAAAISISLMTSLYAPIATAADYTSPIQGMQKDAMVFGQNVVSVDTNGNVVYDFTGENTISVRNDAGVSGMRDAKMIIGTNGGILKIRASSDDYNMSQADGINLTDGSNVVFNGNLDISAKGGNCSAAGISVVRAGAGEGSETHLTINGDVTMRDTSNPDGPWGVTADNLHGGYGIGGSVSSEAPNYTGARWAPSGIYLGMKDGSTIDINGNVDLAVAGTAVKTDPYYKDAVKGDYESAIINMNKGTVNIETPESQTEAYYALASYGGTINVNVDGNTAKNNDVNLSGNIIAMKDYNNSGGPYFYRNGQINIGLTTANSLWKGVIDNSGSNQAGEVNLHLQNGAKWIHKAASKTNGLDADNMPQPSADQYGNYDGVSHLNSLQGGSDINHAGYILQKDKAKLEINNYSGSAVVVYEHANSGIQASDYAAGDTIVKKAATGSEIVLSTDNSGIEMTDNEAVANVLNALAGKLTYSAYAIGENNLSGRVQIASGLTSSSAVQKIGDIIFNQNDGKGTYNAGEKPDVSEGFKTTLTGNPVNDIEYASGGIIENGAYKFIQDTTIFTENASAIGFAKENETTKIDAVDKILNTKVAGTEGDLVGIKTVGFSSGGGQIDAKKLNVYVKNDDSEHTATGIEINTINGNLAINSDVDINVESSKAATGININYNNLNVKGDLKMQSTATGSDSAVIGVETKYGGQVKVDKVDIAVKGTGTGAALKSTYSYGGKESSIEIGNGRIIVDSACTTPVYAISAAGGGDGGGKIYINKNNEAEDVVIKGNVKLEAKGSALKLGLVTADSKLEGVVDNKSYRDTVWEGFWPKTVTDTPDVFLTLQKGASWVNQVQNTITPDFGGSYITNFIGGSSAAEAGYIFQKDKNNLTLENYSGNAVIVYEHSGDGTHSGNYSAGGTIIQSAAAGAVATLSTDNTGINMNDENVVGKALNALASKLTYSNFTKGENTLSGKVQIASGLTASSAAQKVGDIFFDKDTGLGGYYPFNDSQTSKDFTNSITGCLDVDTAYTNAKVLKADGTYVFTKDSNIVTAAGTAPIDAQNKVDVDAEGFTLNLETQDGYGIKGGNKNKIDLTADKINVKVKNPGGRAEGIHLNSKDRAVKDEAVINGDVSINTIGNDYALGVYTSGNSELTINGDVTMKGAGTGDDAWGIVNNRPMGGGWAYYSTSGLYAGSDYAIQQGARINVNGDVDLAVKGTGILANGGNSQININGGGNILINRSDSGINYALVAENATVNMNMNEAGNGAGGRRVNIIGNVGTTNGAVHPDDNAKESIVNLGLSTGDSAFNGVIVNNYTKQQNDAGYYGKANLYLSNGAIWTNEAYGKTLQEFTGSTVESFAGGNDAEHGGYIIQRDENPLTFNNYSGNTTIVYEHANDGTNVTDYAAGDTIVKKAGAESGILLSTDNSGINMGDYTAINKVLNTLAGKLTYSAYASGEKNLSGKVQIASGLTSSSAALKVRDITFDETTGKGGCEAKVPPAEQDTTEFTTSITGDSTEDMDYLLGGVLKDDKYTFTKDSSITISSKGTAAIDAKRVLTIDASGSTLNLAMNGEGGYGAKYGISNEMQLTADKINIKVNNPGERAEGIHLASSYKPAVITGDISVNVAGKGYALGVYTSGSSELTLNGNVTMKGNGDSQWGVTNSRPMGGDLAHYSTSGLYAGANYGSQTGATLNVNGNIDLAIDGTGVMANGANSKANIDGGGNIVINKESAGYNYALVAENATVNMNMNKEGNGSGDKKVTISGNIGTNNGAVHPNDPAKESIVNLGLSTADSVLNGVIVNNYTKEQNDAGYYGKANLYLSNGATWTNESYGRTLREFTGSTVENFVGGNDAEHSGYIIQRDGNPLTFNNYSGYTTIIYDHENSGSQAADYKAGDTKVKAAAEGAVITLSTGNNGIDMNNSQAVEATLGALAQKLYYDGGVDETNVALRAPATLEAAYDEADGVEPSSATTMNNASSNSKTLIGKVQIASGLTAAAAAMKIGDVEFAKDGKAAYVEGSVKNKTDGSKIEYGNNESFMMQGVRSAMTTSMLSWRDNAAESFYRADDLRNGAEQGVWARTFGGKAKYDGNNTHSENSYWAGQLGYDKRIDDDWNVGVSVDYQDGNADYILGGKGNNKLYSVGIYGGKSLDNSAYLNFIAKTGKVKNEYTVYNEIGQKLTGKYDAKGFSLSAQYGKRFGDEAKGYIEPQMQLSWSRLGGDSYQAQSNLGSMYINQDAFNSYVGRIGIETGKTTENISLFAKLSLAHEFAGDITGRYFANDGGVKATRYDLGDTWTELSFGGTYKLSNNGYCYADLSRSLSGDYQHQWKANAGVKFTF